MASSPQYKVYDANGAYQASTKDVAAAACLLGFYGDGATIRYGHKLVVWTQGFTGDATASYDVTADHVASAIPARLRDQRIERSERAARAEATA